MSHCTDILQSIGQETVAGVVTYRRPLSAKLVFYDVLQSGSNDHWWEVVVKAGIYGSAQDVKDLRDSLKLGDEVICTGTLEATSHAPSQSTLRASSVTITRAWKSVQPDLAFNPRPAPRVRQKHLQTSGAQQQQPDKQQQTDAQQQSQQQCTSREVDNNLDCVTLAPDGHPPSTACTPAVGAASAAHTVKAAAAWVTEPQIAVCKFWMNTGSCPKGDACTFLHALMPALGRSRWLKQRVQERQQRAAEKGFVHDSSAAAKRLRAKVLAAWLVQQYGKEQLNAGDGVLDVAGGSGALTFELAHVHGIKCTLIDPRPFKLNKHQHRLLQQAGVTCTISTFMAQDLQQGTVTASVSRPGRPLPEVQQQCQQVGSHDTPLQEQQLIAKVQQGVQQVHIDRDKQQHEAQSSLYQRHGTGKPGSSQQQGVQDGCDRSGSMCCTTYGLQLQQIQGFFGQELWCSPGWKHMFTRCSLVVGLHPDQATEPILEFALREQVPFAVVPCCVFPRMFPDRRVLSNDGAAAAVVNYDQLIQYLVQRGSAVKGVLDFEGANIVVFRAAEPLSAEPAKVTVYCCKRL